MLQQLTFTARHHQITNAQVWSSDSRYIAFDCRANQAVFNNTVIGRIDTQDLSEEIVYESTHGACVGVVTHNPSLSNQLVFIHGPENPDENWSYDFHYRRGVLLSLPSKSLGHPIVENIDGFKELPPFIKGVLHGGSHVHMFSPNGLMLSYTYDDYLMKNYAPSHAKRNVAVSFLSSKLSFEQNHSHQYSGSFYCSVISKTVAEAKWGSNEIEKAYEECFIGEQGYVRSDLTWQRWAIAFMGDLKDEKGQTYSEIFIVDLPEPGSEEWFKFDESAYSQLNAFSNQSIDPTLLQRTLTPINIEQRRLTFTHNDKYKGICQNTRHWLRSSPDGQYIAFLKKDNLGITQLWLALTVNGETRQITHSSHPIDSAFTWHPSGKYIAVRCDNAIQICCINSKNMKKVTETLDPPPNPEAVVYSPCGQWITFTRDVPNDQGVFRQIFRVAHEDS